MMSHAKLEEAGRGCCRRDFLGGFSPPALTSSFSPASSWSKLSILDLRQHEASASIRQRWRHVRGLVCVYPERCKLQRGKQERRDSLATRDARAPLAPVRASS